MDWKYISKLDPEKLNDEHKDELLNTIAWHDLDTEDLDVEKCLTLLKISQQIMRYKSEQVEALIAELDEVATRQGEEEMKRQESEYDTKSIKSKKSSLYEMDVLEEKYREVKTKLKLQIKSNDKQKGEIDKLNDRIKALESDRVHLQNELQSLQQDDSRSDLSETVKEQNKELIDAVQNKNRHISKLLNEIETIEDENIVLKENLANTRDKLAEATAQINKFSEELVANKAKVDDYIETINGLEHEMESLKADVKELLEDKKNYKKQLTEFALEIDTRVDEWKKILDEKNDEIRKLKSLTQDKIQSKSSSISNDDFEPKGQIAALNKIISDRETSIHQLQKQLEKATKEMHATTNVLNKLNDERNSYMTEMAGSKQFLKELKSQLKQCNIRTKEQQDQVLFLENLLAKKDKDLKTFLDKLKDDGHIELSELIAKLQTSKSQKRYKEKQILDLVKTNNELQESMLQIERENTEMRSKLGLTDEDVVYITDTLLKEKKQKKILHELHKKITQLEEENLSLRLEIQSSGKTTDTAQICKTKADSLPQTEDKQQTPAGANLVNAGNHKTVVEENEALRKGLHEILNSLQTRADNGMREIRSETLEQLLRALDVKHISGWYHPAMRLQAELHALQGSNLELREQLKNTRIELESSRKSTDKEPTLQIPPTIDLTGSLINSSLNFDVVNNLNKHLMQIMKENEIITQKNTLLSSYLEKYQCSLNAIEQQITLLYKQYSEEKSEWCKDKETFSKTTKEVTEKVEILENKLKDISKYVNKTKDEQAKLKQVSEMSGTIVMLNRKLLHLENENTKLTSELKIVKQDLLDAEIAVKKKINDLKLEKNSLSNQLGTLKMEGLNGINLIEHKKLLNNFDNLTLKHRSLLSNLTEICSQNSNEVTLMNASVDLLKIEKEELQNKLKDVILKLNTCDVAAYEVDKAVEHLSKKLSQIEINEITERQRANHMTNLYELVKEQLKKSEERYKEFEKYSKDLMYRNLSLQECLKDFQDKAINEIDLNDYSLTKSKSEKLREDNAKLSKELEQLQDKLEVAEKLANTQKLWSSSQEYEFLSLKHQILDLQASTDDKAVISRLSSDVIHARLQEAEAQKRIESISDEYKKLEVEYNSYKSNAEEEYMRLNDHVKTLMEKNEKLKSLTQDKIQSKSSSISNDDFEPKGQIAALNKIISDRETSIHQLQKQLEKATKEMHATTNVLNKLNDERNSYMTEMAGSKQFLKELKSQLKQCNIRTKEQQDQVLFLENLLAKKDKDLKTFLDKLKDDGHIELSELIAKLQTSKSQKRYKEKQILDLVKTNNELQESMLQIERENTEMRSKLGLTDEDVVYITDTLLKEKKQKKILHELHKKITQLEEENLSLRLEIQSSGKTTDTAQICKTKADSLPQTEYKQQTPANANLVNAETHKTVVEENEALRKGLHEILNSLQTRADNGMREIRSETLEQLLRALDVKHISGWYHPAMRLQAELHALQGSNLELREQLKNTRIELESSRKSTDKEPTLQIPPTIDLTGSLINSSLNFDVVNNLNKHLMQIMKENEIITQKNTLLSSYLEKYQCSLNAIEQQITLLYKQYSEEKSEWCKDKETFSKTTKEVTEKVEILENKLKDISKYVNKTKDEQAKLKQVSEMSGTIVMLNRKLLHLENENTKLTSELKIVKQDLLDAEIAVKKKINDLKLEKNSLSNQLGTLKMEGLNGINLIEHKKLLNNFDNLTLKHRSLLSNLTEICSQNSNEVTLMNASVDLLKIEKEELQNKLKDVILKLNTCDVVAYEVDKAVEHLSKKLSQIEINEITERQRANHMTNLYELVKEQLKKSEERYKEFEKYSKDLMYRNLSLQECLKDFQDKAINEIDLNDYSLTKSKSEKLREDNAKLSKELEQLQDKLEVAEKLANTQKLWSSSQEYEFLSLKHQILDLQASTDDKAVISRLSSDVIHARLQEAEAQKRIESISDEYKKLEVEYNSYKSNAEEEYMRLNDHVKTLMEKNDLLQRIVGQQRQQYFGFVPMTSEEKFVHNLIKIYKDKYESFLCLQKSDECRHENEVIKEQLREQLKLIEELNAMNKNDDKIAKWHNEKYQLQLQELKHRRHSEFIGAQLHQALGRIKEQDQLMSKLEEELLQAYQGNDFCISSDVQSIKLHENGSNQKTDNDEINDECKVKIFKSEETQTIFDVHHMSLDSNKDDDALKKLHLELVTAQKEVSSKDETIEQLKSKQTELEINNSMFKKQLGDKQSQIMFYEKHILELQSKKEVTSQEVKMVYDVDITRNEEYVALKAMVATLQSTLAEKEAFILKFQSLLKQDRDEHSLAAARMQEELKRLQNALVTHQQAYKELKESQSEVVPNKVAVEQYIKQVHTLEDHTSGLHTIVASLETQLQSSREECVRWRALSNDRLQSMEKLRQELETVHRNEVCVYREECEKWRQEVLNLKSILVKHTDNTNDKVNSVQKILKERDDRIHELMVQLRQARIEGRKKQENAESPKLQELEGEVEQVTKELETMRKRHEQLLNREKSARDEIRTLKGQLIKRPASAARSDRSDTAKEQLQKKVAMLEKEAEDLRQNLKEQLVINEQHRVKVNDDFEKWNKQKYWQQTAEKLKLKLREKTEELEKVQQTCSGYRILIERLEKEKHVLESKNKTLRGCNANVNTMKLEVLEIENAKLQAELEAMGMKLEMQQHHSGGLGAAMLQDKLEGQERKIAILELAAKGTGELRGELERVQALNASLQKSNLRLEAENLEFKLDMEKSSKELPHLREQIQHLETYIEVLKNESSTKHEVTNSGDHAGNESKKTAELERTVFVLKRIVEKLQAENKRLQGGSKIIGDKVPDETLRRDFYRLKEQYGDRVQKVARLEDELTAANNKIKNLQVKQNFASELDDVKNQLSQKTELLDKVKVLLHRAAVKQKTLVDEITKLKTMVPCSTASISSN